MSTRRPLPTIGVDKYTYFPLTTDTASAVAYGEAVSFPGTVEISPTDNGANETFDADNGAYETFSYIETMGHEITNADIPPEVEAAWRGLQMKNGGVEIGVETEVPYFGVAWRILKSNGKYRYVRYYKGKYGFASNVGGKTKPSDGAPEAQTAKAKYTAVKRNNDDQIMFYIDEDELPQGWERATIEYQFFTDMP